MGVQEQSQGNNLYFPPTLEISISKEELQVKKPIILFLRNSMAINNHYKLGLQNQTGLKSRFLHTQCDLGKVV